MTGPDLGGLAGFLAHGGIGFLAILCLVVLGYNVWSLNRLVETAQPAKVTAARPLLLAQMAVSLVGAFALGGAAIYLDAKKSEDSKERTAQLLIDPWEDIDSSQLPQIMLEDKLSSDRPIKIPCTPGRPTTVKVNLQNFLDYRASRARQAAQVLSFPTASR